MRSWHFLLNRSFKFWQLTIWVHCSRTACAFSNAIFVRAATSVNWLHFVLRFVHIRLYPHRNPMRMANVFTYALFSSHDLTRNYTVLRCLRISALWKIKVQK